MDKIKYSVKTNKSTFSIIKPDKLLFLKYYKYRVLKNFVFGSTKERYKRKQKELHEKIKCA